MNSILVVDDDAMFRAIMRRHLNQLGFRVIEADSGLGVAALIRNDPPLACLIDLVMDEQEGIETIREIMAQPHPPKVIAVSSNAAYLDLASAFAPDATLLKPIAPDVLRATLEQLGVGSD